MEFQFGTFDEALNRELELDGYEPGHEEHEEAEAEVSEPFTGDDMDVEDTNVPASTAPVQTIPPSEPVPFSEPSMAEFLKIVQTCAQQGKQFSGEINSSEGSDSLATAFRNYQFRVHNTIQMTGVKSDAMKAQVAMAFLTGTAESQVITLSPNGIMTFDQIMNYLSTLVKGVVKGPVSITITLLDYDLLVAGIFTAKKHNGRAPDLGYELSLMQRYWDQREPMDPLTVCAVYIHALRSLPTIRDRVKRVTVEGVTSEQTDPAKLKLEIIACDPEFKAAVTEALKGKMPISGAKRVFSDGAGPSNAPRQNKKYSASKAKYAEGSGKQAGFNPFDANVKRSPKNFPGAKPWVKGLTQALKDQRRTEHACFVCGNTQEPLHPAAECPHRGAMYKRQEFCYFKK